MHEAKYYEQQGNNRLRCLLCPHLCTLSIDDLGLCRARKNFNGELYTLNFGQTVTINVDPIEKKPLYHFYPRSNILSIGCNSCNLSCDFCQNYSISQYKTKTVAIPPSELVTLCSKHAVKQVAFTYTEPMTWFEYVLAAAPLLRNIDVKTVLVTNGYVNQEPLSELLPHIDALNIDIKSLSDEFYRSLCNGTLKPVLETVETSFQSCHIELTNLLIPGVNDSADQISDLVDYISSVDRNIPLHFSRYFPNYKRATEPTSFKTMKMAYEIGRSKLNHVYLGNVLTDTEADTICSVCKTTLITRKNFNISILNLIDNKCKNCNSVLYGRF